MKPSGQDQIMKQYFVDPKKDEKSDQKNLECTNYLQKTGILDAYEHVYSTMLLESWPHDQSAHEHAAYLLLKWQSDHRDYLFSQGKILQNHAHIHSPLKHQTISSINKGNSLKIDGFTEPRKMELKSKVSRQFKNNRINSDVFQGAHQKAFQMLNQQELNLKEEQKKMEIMLQIEKEFGDRESRHLFPYYGKAQMNSVKPQHVFPVKVKDSIDFKNLKEQQQYNEIKIQDDESRESLKKIKIQQDDSIQKSNGLKVPSQKDYLASDPSVNEQSFENR